MYNERLKLLRINSKLTQKDIADILNIERNTYSEYENEYNTIPISHLNKLCNYYKVSFDYIFNFNNLPKYKNSNIEINIQKAKDRLKELRISKKYTQQQFGKLFGIAKTTICGYERGNRIIATTILYDICKKYNLSADYLLGKSDEPKYLK